MRSPAARSLALCLALLRNRLRAGNAAELLDELLLALQRVGAQLPAVMRGALGSGGALGQQLLQPGADGVSRSGGMAQIDDLVVEPERVDAFRVRCILHQHRNEPPLLRSYRHGGEFYPSQRSLLSVVDFATSP